MWVYSKKSGRLPAVQLLRWLPVEQRRYFDLPGKNKRRRPFNLFLRPRSPRSLEVLDRRQVGLPLQPSDNLNRTPLFFREQVPYLEALSPSADSDNPL